MLDEDKEVWVRVYCAYTSGRGGGTHYHADAKKVAEQALDEFHKRFPVKEVGYRESAK